MRRAILKTLNKRILILFSLLNNEQNVEVCDATTVDQGTEVGVTIIQLTTIKNFKKEKKTPI